MHPLWVYGDGSFKNANSCEPLALYRFDIEPLSYALRGRAVS
jgi:hypothetical protein